MPEQAERAGDTMPIRGEQVVAPPFRYAGRIGSVAVLLSGDRHWLAREGDAVGSPAIWQVAEITADWVKIVDASSSRVEVLPFSQKR